MTDDKPLYVTDPEKWLQDTAKGPDLLCIVFFRGSWCKYDKYYLRKLGEHHITTMKAENVTLIAWTSEGAAGAAKADEEWGLTKDFGYDMVIGDETNALANHLKEDEILPGLVTATPGEAKVTGLTEGAYPNGIVMPAMVWYAHHGNIVLQWASKFEAPSWGGASGRPEVAALWVEILKRKHALDHGNAIMPVHGEMKLCATEWEVNVANYCVIL